MRLIVALAALAAAPSAWACSCLQPDLKQQWHEASDFVGVKVLAERLVGQERQFRVRVIQPFSGCTQNGDELVLTTPRDSATCGASFQIGERYVMAVHDAGRVVGGLPARSVISCDFTQTFASLTADQLDFLMSRPIDCPGAPLACADGSQPVSCLVDPCTNATCVDGDCEDNTCGGCIAEFWDDQGYPVCEPW